MKDEYKLYVESPLMSSNLREKKQQRERLLSDPTPPSVILNLRDQMQMSDLRIVSSVTAAKKTLQKKYYSRKKQEVISLDESIHDEASFDRKLKLFLRRRKKLELVSYLEHKSVPRIRNEGAARRKEKDDRYFEKAIPTISKDSVKRNLVESTTFLVEYQTIPIRNKEYFAERKYHLPRLSVV